MILSGEKKEEYRDLKEYWVNRLCDPLPPSVISGGDLRATHNNAQYELKKFTSIVFSNGYQKKSTVFRD